MATFTPSIALGTAWLNSIRTALNAGGNGNPATIDIYSGTKPARPDTDISAQIAAGTIKLLGTVTCSDDCGAVSTIDGVPTLTFAAITSDSAADATGVAAWGRASCGGAPTAVLDFDITTIGGAGFGQMNTTNVVVGGPIATTDVIITA